MKKDGDGYSSKAGLSNNAYGFKLSNYFQNQGKRGGSNQRNNSNINMEMKPKKFVRRPQISVGRKDLSDRVAQNAISSQIENRFENV